MLVPQAARSDQTVLVPQCARSEVRALVPQAARSAVTLGSKVSDVPQAARRSVTPVPHKPVPQAARLPVVPVVVPQAARSMTSETEPSAFWASVGLRAGRAATAVLARAAGMSR